MEKLVSIIMPTYNGAARLASAVSSIRNQSYKNWELVIVDDGSQDKTADVVRELVSMDSRIRYLRNDVNLGIQKSLNKGIENTHGEYIARIDDDDVWSHREKLKDQVDFLDNNSDCVLIGTGAIVVDERGKEIFRYLFPETDKDIRSKILQKNCFVHSGVLFTKKSFIECGGYSESEEVKHLEDYDLWLKMGTVGTLHNLPLYGITFMMRGQSLSWMHKKDQLLKALQLIKKYKNKYPGFVKGYFKSLIRAYGYMIALSLVPNTVIKNIFIFYKKNW